MSLTPADFLQFSGDKQGRQDDVWASPDLPFLLRVADIQHRRTERGSMPYSREKQNGADVETVRRWAEGM